MQRSDADRAFDQVDSRQPVAIVARDRHAVLVDDAQVGLDQPEHVEIAKESGCVVQPVKGMRHAGDHLPGLQLLGGHRRAGDELQHHHLLLRHVLQHARADPS